MKMRNLKCAVLAFAIIIPLCLCDIDESSTISELKSTTENEISDNVTISNQPLISTGNELWDGLIRDCLKKPTFSCIQKNVYTFLDATFGLKDVNITNRVQLTQNNVNYELPEPTPNDEENEIFFEGRGKLSTRAKLIFYCIFNLYGLVIYTDEKKNIFSLTIKWKRKNLITIA